MVATLTWVLAPAPASGLIRQRSGHHYEVRLGLGIVFMYNMSMYDASWGPRWSRPSRWGWRRRRTSGRRSSYRVVIRRPRRSHRHPKHVRGTSGSPDDWCPCCNVYIDIYCHNVTYIEQAVLHNRRIVLLGDMTSFLPQTCSFSILKVSE